jgi:hypothetical protein
VTRAVSWVPVRILIMVPAVGRVRDRVSRRWRRQVWNDRTAPSPRRTTPTWRSPCMPWPPSPDTVWVAAEGNETGKSSQIAGNHHHPARLAGAADRAPSAPPGRGTARDRRPGRLAVARDHHQHRCGANDRRRGRGPPPNVPRSARSERLHCLRRRPLQGPPPQELTRDKRNIDQHSPADRAERSGLERSRPSPAVRRRDLVPVSVPGQLPKP